MHPTPRTPSAPETLHFAQRTWQVRRPKPFVLVIEGEAGQVQPGWYSDYLHEVLLQPQWREDFYQLVDATGLVACLNVDSQHPTYRDVRGRSSKGRLSQGEYYHHDGCSGPVKPRFVEIRCPVQPVLRSVATAVAPFTDVVPAMLACLPSALAAEALLAPWCARLAAGEALGTLLTYAELEQLQGLITRTVRRKLDAEAARAYFRAVDAAANAYFAPWHLGESRFIANANAGVTMQHRRAYQAVNRVGVANGSLVKRWTNEELVAPGQEVDRALLAALCSEEDGEMGGACARRDRS